MCSRSRRNVSESKHHTYIVLQVLTSLPLLLNVSSVVGGIIKTALGQCI